MKTVKTKVIHINAETGEKRVVMEEVPLHEDRENRYCQTCTNPRYPFCIEECPAVKE